MGMDSAYRHKAVMAFGIVQIVIGAVVFGCGIAVVVQKSWVEVFFHGIWGGIWIIMTGIFGLIGGLKKNRCLEIAFMVLSIISAVTIWYSLLFISLAGMVGDSIYSKEEAFKDRTTDEKISCADDMVKNFNKESYEGYVKCPNKPAALTNAIIALMAGLLFLMAILSASFACCAVCKCCGGGSENNVQSVSYNGQHQAAQAHYGGGQYGY